MKGNNRILIILALVIVLPILIYAALQTQSLAEDEKVANQVYEKQMETILFSLNQYADDYMDRWIRTLGSEEKSIEANARMLVRENEAIQLLSIRSLKTGKSQRYYSEYVGGAEADSTLINGWYQQQPDLIDQLCRYLEAGFQKIQPATDFPALPGLQGAQAPLTVMFYDKDSAFYSALFVLEPYYWTEQLLGLNMQEIAQNNNLRLAVMQRNDTSDQPQRIYQTEPFDLERDFIQNELWILPQTFLTIQTKGRSYAELIRDRSKNNLYILLSSLIVMLIGTLIVMRNIRKAVKIAQLKSDFVSNVSHEIRTPLSLIRMYSETLLMGRLPSEEKKQQYYQVIHHESGRLTYMVNNILDFSKIEANKKQYQKEVIELNTIIQQIKENYAFALKEKQMTCTLSLTESSTRILIDRTAIEEAISNLLDNAIKYSGESKKIEIITEIKGNAVLCHVKDFGLGIPKSAQGQVFEKFYRVESALTQKTKGTGLGLSLVKHIVEAHDGKILLQSKSGEGSTFTLQFPKHDQE
ncbi:sensor histidine kinase [Reichenbachiella ulvae]|uniref:histidine kinase n=1 Tax=Reichenbachiella ulvae TaxID=2980104 RepID=A0ABT3CNX5_9BACT|nr:ATP-binding protein [Reichenbachiella ulvae]MCV9385347.1 ATP-binding protein [Reichenbachiella ulvae]